MTNSIFSTYKTGENRVTASILAVLQSLALTRTERLIAALLEDTGFELVRFQNQPSKGAAGIPDAMISSHFKIFLETKIKRNTVSTEQLERHLKRFDSTAGSRSQWCLVLTPDGAQPEAIGTINDPRLVWASFANLNQAIDDLLSDPFEVISEREAFLLRELQSMLAAEDLIGFEKEVVVVPARRAWDDYKRLNAYLCQPNRPFQSVKYIAFYVHGEITPCVPEILEVHDEVVYERDRYEGELGALVTLVLELDPSRLGSSNKVFLLTSPDDPGTRTLKDSVVNDLVSDSGRTVAFTQSQRYVSLQDLLQAKRTSDLVRG